MLVISNLPRLQQRIKEANSPGRDGSAQSLTGAVTVTASVKPENLLRHLRSSVAFYAVTRQHYSDKKPHSSIDRHSSLSIHSDEK